MTGGAIFGAFVACFIPVVLGHGRLIEPPSRSSMWKFGFNTPTNYNDNQLFCGGFANQWENNGGACGVCGDPYEGPQHNMAGGIYATGIISRCYDARTSVIEVAVQVTANHKGYFEFRLCEHNNTHTTITQECLNQHVLKEAYTGLTQLVVTEDTGVKRFLVVLPPQLTCTQCVIQWKYHTGNSWGCKGQNTECCLGCGPQEEFYGCADIAILPDCGTTVQGTEDTESDVDKLRPTASTLTATRTRTGTTTTTTITTPMPTTTTTYGYVSQDSDDDSEFEIVSHTNCRAIGVWAKFRGMDGWCVDNCGRNPPNCPASHCYCGELDTDPRQWCRAVEFWAHVRGMNEWCVTSCTHDPPHCPASHCTCLH